MNTREWYGEYLDQCVSSCKNWISKYEQKKEALIKEYSALQKRLAETQDPSVEAEIQQQIANIQSENRKLQASSSAGNALLKRLESGELAEDPFVEIQKNVKIERIDCADRDLRVYTTPLTYQGDYEEYRGQDIGSYLIKINVSRPSEIVCHNRTKREGSYDHWGISCGSPCFGDWRESVSKPLSSGGLKEGIELFIFFLEQAGDVGAYVSISEWLDEAIEIDEDEIGCYDDY